MFSNFQRNLLKKIIGNNKMSYAKYGDLVGKTDSVSKNNNVKSIVPEISNIQNKQDAIKHNKIAVFKIYGDWCGPCKSISGAYGDLFKEHSSPGECAILSENVDLGLSPSIRAVPAFQLFKNGSYITTIIGPDIGGVKNKIIELKNSA